MTTHAVVPRDPDLRGVPDALLRAAENARRLAEQTRTPFIVRQPTTPDEVTGKREIDPVSPMPTNQE